MKIDLRKTIRSRMKAQGIPSGYALARLIEHRITVATIDRYLKGKSEMTSGNIELILDALDAESIRFKKPREKPD